MAGFFLHNFVKTDTLICCWHLIPNKSVLSGKCGVFHDDSIVRGTQLKDNVKHLHAGGIKEIHMRIACSPLIYACEYLNFSRSRTSLDLATCLAIKQLEGHEDVDLKAYSDTSNAKYANMVEQMRKNLGLTTLKF